MLLHSIIAASALLADQSKLALSFFISLCAHPNRSHTLKAQLFATGRDPKHRHRRPSRQPHHFAESRK